MAQRRQRHTHPPPSHPSTGVLTLNVCWQVIATPYAVTFRHIDCAAATHAVRGQPWHCMCCHARLPCWQCAQAWGFKSCPAQGPSLLCCPAPLDCGSGVQLNFVHLATIKPRHTLILVTDSILVVLCLCVHCQRESRGLQAKMWSLPTRRFGSGCHQD